MPRYFLEVSYKGTHYSGFQVQENAKTIQSEVEAALQTLYRQSFSLTGSSRTDAGVHALRNFFHFDAGIQLFQKEIYNLNAILPPDISATAYYIGDPDAHSRFGATSREYRYYVYNKKNPFLQDRGWYYPFTIDHGMLDRTAAVIKDQSDFISFSKRNTQVKNYKCIIEQSDWERTGEGLVYHVKANRFLRGMIRALVSSMLKTARAHNTLDQFLGLFREPAQATADFSAPPQGLFLVDVVYPAGYLRLLD